MRKLSIFAKIDNWDNLSMFFLWGKRFDLFNPILTELYIIFY